MPALPPTLPPTPLPSLFASSPTLMRAAAAPRGLYMNLLATLLPSLFASSPTLMRAAAAPRGLYMNLLAAGSDSASEVAGSAGRDMLKRRFGTFFRVTANAAAPAFEARLIADPRRFSCEC